MKTYKRGLWGGLLISLIVSTIILLIIYASDQLQTEPTGQKILIFDLFVVAIYTILLGIYGFRVALKQGFQYALGKATGIPIGAFIPLLFVYGFLSSSMALATIAAAIWAGIGICFAASKVVPG